MLDIAFSPCPNDTFIFFALANNLLSSPLKVKTHYDDVQNLNLKAFDKRYPVSKVSIQALGALLQDYILLPSGAALGHNCGPKIIAKEKFSIEELSEKRIAIPGKDTTAHFLSQIFTKRPKEKVFCLFNDVVPLIQTGEVDCGLIIHETRFTFEESGLVEIADLGELWFKETSLPLPLGGIVAKRSLGKETLDQVTKAITASIIYSYEHPEEASKYILEHSDIKDFDVVQAHIDLYVNEESICLSEAGIQAIEKLLSLGREKGIIPHSKENWLHPHPQFSKELLCQ